MILHNNIPENGTDFSEKILENGLSIYEVIRIFNKKPIFLKDNIQRLGNSLKKSNISIDPSSLNVPEKLARLISLENIQEGNLKYVLHFTDGKETDEYIYRIPHSYPDSKAYEQGVDTITCHAVRENPEVKYINGSLREQANRLINEHHVYEVLLTDDEGFITEGSRSNVFFISGDHLRTAPTSCVLPGTSRKRVFDICKAQGIAIVEEKVPLSSIGNFDAAFITGTSPLILPIRSIDGIAFNPQCHLLRKLMKEYFSLLENNF